MATIYYNRITQQADSDYIRNLDQKYGNGRAPFTDVEQAKATAAEQSRVASIVNGLSSRQKRRVTMQTAAASSAGSGQSTTRLPAAGAWGWQVWSTENYSYSFDKAHQALARQCVDYLKNQNRYSRVDPKASLNTSASYANPAAGSWGR